MKKRSWDSPTLRLPGVLILPMRKSPLPRHRVCYLLVFSRQVVSDLSWPMDCPSPSPRMCPSSCPLSRWYHTTISSSVTLFSFCLLSFSESGSFLMSKLFTSGGQSIGASALASVLPKSIQGWFPSRLTGLISFLSKRLSRVFYSTRVWKHQFFGG